MEDLSITSSLFILSSKLKQAAVSLEKITTASKLDDSDQKIMSWAGQFLCAMDLSCSKGQPCGGLAVQATSIRPTFYSCLIRFVEDGTIRNEKSLNSFLIKLYDVLQYPAEPAKTKKLKAEEIKLASLLLKEMSESSLYR